VNAVAAFLDKNPLFAFGVSFVVFLVIPLVSDLADRSRKWVSAETAYSNLRDEVEPQLVDIRGIDEIEDVGSPDISSFNKKVVQVTYTGDEDAFLYEMRKRFKEPAQTTLYILDMYDGNSMEVAQMLTRNGFRAVYAIRDGFQGSNGWQAVGEILFPKTVHVDTGNGATVSQDHKVNVSASAAVDTEALQSQTKESTILPSSFGTEARISSAPQPATVEPAVEPLSSIRPLSPYPLYPDLKPPTSPTPSKPASKSVHVSTNNGPAISDLKVDVSGAAIESAPAEAVAKAPFLPRPLSPYPQYPDLKPPTSPTPSKPTGKTIGLSSDNAATISDEKVDVSTQTSKSASFSFSFQSSPIKPASETPSLPRSSSPYPQYADLKPPTSPTTSKPTFKTVDAVTNSSSTISNQKVDASSPTTKSVAVSSSLGGGDGIDLASQSALVEPITEIPCLSRPLSPYPQYPDLKPPTSPTPSRP